MHNNGSDKWFRLFLGKVYNERVKLNLMQALPFWVASLITGLVAVAYSKMFSWCEQASFHLFHGERWLLFLVMPVCFVLAWWVVKKFDKRAEGSGIPQVIAAVELAEPKYNHLVDKFLSVRGIWVKILSNLLMVFGGAAVGREGPTVQIAGSIFHKINRSLPKNWVRISKKNMIMAGAAAGLGAAFNTPLGGVVFAIEELSKTHFNRFKTALFTAVIIAGLTAQGLLGPYLYLGYPDVRGLSWFIFLFVIIVAVICGAAGSGMCLLIVKLMAWRKTLQGRKTEVIYIAGVALLMATVAYCGQYSILGSGKVQMSEVLFANDVHTDWSLPLWRIIGPVGCFTTGGAGGVFAPALSTGAIIGNLVAGLFHMAAANAHLLALAGMVAFLTGVTRSPFTSAILVLEMTDRHSIIFYLLLAGMIAGLAAMLVDKRSLYDRIKDNYIHDAHDEVDKEEKR